MMSTLEIGSEATKSQLAIACFEATYPKKTLLLVYNRSSSRTESSYAPHTFVCTTQKAIETLEVDPIDKRLALFTLHRYTRCRDLPDVKDTTALVLTKVCVYA